MKIDSSVGSLTENRARAIGMFHILKNDTWVRVDMEFLFECLTRERSERVRCRVEHEKKKFHIYKQPCIILFINTIAICEQEKSTLLMKGKKRIDSPRKKVVKCVGDRAHEEKCVESLKKQTMGVTFNLQNSQLLTFPCRLPKFIQVHSQTRLVANLPLSIFVLSHGKCHYQSHWVGNFRYFFPF